MESWKRKNGVIIPDGPKVKEMNPSNLPKRQKLIPNLDVSKMSEQELVGAMLAGANLPLDEEKFIDNTYYAKAVDLMMFYSIQAMIYHYCRKNGINPEIHREQVVKQMKKAREMPS